MKLSVAENWVEAPLKQFVDEARVQLAVLLNRERAGARPVRLHAFGGRDDRVRARRGDDGVVRPNSAARSTASRSRDCTMPASVRQIFLGQDADAAARR